MVDSSRRVFRPVCLVSRQTLDTGYLPGHRKAAPLLAASRVSRVSRVFYKKEEELPKPPCAPFVARVTPGALAVCSFLPGHPGHPGHRQKRNTKSDASGVQP